MDEHLDAVASRAMIAARPTGSRELRDVLALYAEEPKPVRPRNGGKRNPH
jgi:hypothetical protein